MEVNAEKRLAPEEVGGGSGGWSEGWSEAVDDEEEGEELVPFPAAFTLPTMEAAEAVLCRRAFVTDAARLTELWWRLPLKPEVDSNDDVRPEPELTMEGTEEEVEEAISCTAAAATAAAAAAEADSPPGDDDRRPAGGGGTGRVDDGLTDVEPERMLPAGEVPPWSAPRDPLMTSMMLKTRGDVRGDVSADVDTADVRAPSNVGNDVLTQCPRLSSRLSTPGGGGYREAVRPISPRSPNVVSPYLWRMQAEYKNLPSTFFFYKMFMLLLPESNHL